MKGTRSVCSLRADDLYFLAACGKTDVCEAAFLIVFQYPAVSPEFMGHVLTGCLTVGIVRINSDWLSSEIL